MLARLAGAGPYGAGADRGRRVAAAGADRGGFAGEVEGGSLGYARAAGIGEADLGRSRLFLDGQTSDGWILPAIQGRGRPTARSPCTTGASPSGWRPT